MTSHTLYRLTESELFTLDNGWYRRYKKGIKGWVFFIPLDPIDLLWWVKQIKAEKSLDVVYCHTVEMELGSVNDIYRNTFLYEDIYRHEICVQSGGIRNLKVRGVIKF